MPKLEIDAIQSGYRSLQRLNTNFDAIETAFENTLSRDGTAPNQMEASIDMNSNPLLNLPTPTTAQEPATKAYVDELALGTPNVLLALSDLSNATYTQEESGAVERTALAKLSDIAHVDDYDGTLATALTKTNRDKPIIDAEGGMYFGGNVVIDADDQLTTSMLPNLTSGRGALFVLANPSAADLVAGVASGIYIHIGNNPTATPGANDAVAQTVTINNLNGRTHLWGANFVCLQDASGADGMTRSIEAEINNVKGAQPDPFTGGTPYKKVAIEVVGHGSSTFSPTAGMTIWANGQTQEKFFEQGIAISRSKVGVKAYASPGGSTDTDPAFAIAFLQDLSNSNAVLAAGGTHGSIIDLSGNPTFSQFILGKGNANTNINIKNSADYAVNLSVDSGASAAQLAAFDFSDRGSAKWRIAKNSGNSLFIIADPVGTPVNVVEFASGGGGAIGIGATPSIGGLDIGTGQIRIRTARTPASATAAGTQGEIGWDTNYFYVCTATNTWRRVAHATW